MNGKLLAVMAMFFFLVGAASHADPSTTSLQDVIEASGVQGGLIVHVGCGDGQLTTALRKNGRFIVHGLDRDQANVERTLARAEELDLAGRVTACRWDGGRLPFNDNFVNLLLTDDASDSISEDGHRRGSRRRGSA